MAILDGDTWPWSCTLTLFAQCQHVCGKVGSVKIKTRPTLDPKLLAVLGRLCEKLGVLTKTQAVKLPYLVDVAAKAVIGSEVTHSRYEAWALGVVCVEAWGATKNGEETGVLSVEEVPYSEFDSKRIRLAGTIPPVLSQDELAVVDYIAEEFGSLDFIELGMVTKRMNVEIPLEQWGSNKAPRVDSESFSRMGASWQRALTEIGRHDTNDKSKWRKVSSGREALAAAIAS